MKQRAAIQPLTGNRTSSPLRIKSFLLRTVRRRAPAVVIIIAGIVILAAFRRPFHWDLSRSGAGWVSLHLEGGRISAFISNKEAPFLKSLADARPVEYRDVIRDYYGRMAALDRIEKSYPAYPQQIGLCVQKWPLDTRPLDQRVADTRRIFREEFVRHLPRVLGDRSFYCRFTVSPAYGLVLRFSGNLLLCAGLVYLAFDLICGPTRRWWRRKHRLCVNCAYNLTGNVSGVCPECGKPVPEETETSGGMTLK